MLILNTKRLIKKGIQFHKILKYIRKKSLFFISVSLLFLFLYLALVSRISAIDKALPYPGHVDEPTIIGASLRILKSGDFNPRSFCYPSLPVYLTFFNMSAGMLYGASRGDIKNIKEIGTMSYPYFTHPHLVRLPKYFFALLSVLSILFIAIAGFYTMKNKCLLFIIPLLLSTSAVFFYLSHQYLNTDIVGCFFVCALIAFQAVSMKKDTISYKSIFPGIITGLATASKYNLLFIIVPSILVILLFSKKKVLNLLLLILCIIVVFIISVPYSILDFKTFFNSVCYEAYHYGKDGHRGYTAEPGWGQFAYYYSILIKDFGSLSVFFVISGILGLFLYDVKKAAVLYSFPLVFFCYMCSQKVHFVRNIVSLFAFYSFFAGIGIVFLIGILYHSAKGIYRLLRERAFVKKNNLLRVIFTKKKLSIILLMIIICIMLLPFGFIAINSKINNRSVYKGFDKIFPLSNIERWLHYPVDSRTRAEEWIVKNIKEGQTIVFPDELHMDVRNLKQRYRIVVLKYKDYTYSKDGFFNTIKKYRNPYIVMPVFGFDKRFSHRKKYSDRLNSFMEGLESVIDFFTPPGEFPEYFPGEDHEVLYAYTYPVPGGSPLFSICRIKDEKK
ncbi:MAG: hypothetical protein JXB88_02555 [Spirochaetales bacterium]|nr:hypothetical protein [Spirochaetales bacterium]